MRSLGEILEGMEPPFGPTPGLPARSRSFASAKAGRALAARCEAPAAALRALLRGLDVDWRLELALTYYEQRLLAGPAPGLWRHALRKAALGLAKGRPLLGLAEAETGKPGGQWQPGFGTVVFTLPVIDWGGPLSTYPARLVELLALDPDSPARWWRLTGALSWLGADAAVAPDRDLGPLRLWEHPLDWTLAGGEASGAACLLDPEGDEAGGARRLLMGPRDLAVLGPRDAAVAYGRRLKRLQARLRPKLPKVLIEARGQRTEDR